jgi:hypothetical protein
MICYKCKELEVPEGKKYKLCKPCNAFASKVWRQKNPEKYREYENKRDKITTSDNWRLRRYGISKEEFSSLLTKQNNVCAICKTDTPGRGRNFHVDHNHKTGKIRGLLCDKCNRGLGYFNDSLDVLKSALGYLNEN